MASATQPAETTDRDEVVHIVRYPNRRFYDRTQSRYVTLQEIAALVKDGATIVVRDSKTDKDITGRILTQILLETHPERVELFPAGVLHVMIRANDIVLGFLGEYLRQALTYLDFWQRAAAFGTMSAPLQWMKGLLPASETPPSPPAADSSAETLARRVAELERRLKDMDSQGKS